MLYVQLRAQMNMILSENNFIQFHSISITGAYLPSISVISHPLDVQTCHLSVTSIVFSFFCQKLSLL